MTIEANSTGLFDAITAGIESASPTPPEQNDEAINSDGDATSENTDGLEAGDGQSEDSSADDSALEADSEGADDSADTDGESDSEVDGEQAAKDDEQPAAKADDKKGAQAEQKPVAKDPINDPIPNALKKETKERIQSLISAVKERDVKVEKAIAERDELVAMITETRATPEQYGDALNYLKLINSGDPVLQKQALQIMQQEVAALAKIIGEPVAGVDMLEGHADLQQAVRDNLLLEEHAREIAAARESKKIATQASTQRQQTTQAQQAQTQAVANAREELNTVGMQLQKTDPDFARKRDILVPSLKPVFETMHPSQWAKTFKLAYDNLKLPRVTKTGTVPVNQPLRAKNPSGGAKAAPGSLLEAISDGIASAGR